MRFFVLLLFFSMAGCLSEIKTPEYKVTRECKRIYDDTGLDTDICKYTNSSGGSFCASGFSTTTSTPIPCDFYEGIK